MLETMKSFTIWVINQIPNFLMSEPIIYFVSIIILFWLVKLIFSLSVK